jgi:N5-(cytidine 5'-diphosphoramidyl)-L-glutamine hydrolase
MNNQKKKIGITLRIEKIKKYNEKRDAISHDWVKFLEKINVIPIFIPNTLNNTKQFLEEMKLDGLIMSGGDNKGDDIERDNTEKEIIEFAVKRKIPLLGICRGMQIINNFFGGNQVTTNNMKHVIEHHKIDLIGDVVQNHFQTKEMKVNSFHNNIINKNSIGKNLEIFALAEMDNTVEGFYHEKFPILGIMWHPEREQNISKEIELMKIFYEKIFWSE